MGSGPDVLVLTALLLPAAVFILLAVVAPLRRIGRLAAMVSILGALSAFVAAVMAWRSLEGLDAPVRRIWTWLPEHQGALASVGILADEQSTVMLLLVTLVALLVQIYSVGYLAGEPAPALGRYFMYQSLFAFSMMGLVLAPNFLQLFICWELVGLCSYLLIGFWYRKASAARAAVKAFWTTKAGDVGLLIGIVFLWRLTGTFDFGQLEAMAAASQIPLAGLGVITFCIYLGAAGKSAQFPLHIWLPDAMEGPTPVSALIHAATMVTAGVYLLTRTAFLFHLTPDVLLIVAWVGAFTALMAAVLACVQTDIKRVLAYSTVSQLGYMMTALGAGLASVGSFHPGFVHLLTHGVFKALLFLGAGAVIHAVGTNDITRMGGLARRMPQTMIVFLVGTLSLAGIPVFGGFMSKEEILGVVWAHGLTVPFLMLLMGAFLTAFYMMRVVILTFFGVESAHAPDAHAAADAHDDHQHGPAHDAPAIMTLPLWVLALASMAIGIYFTWHHVETDFTSPAWLTPAAVSMAVGGIGLAWLTYQRRSINENTLANLFGPIRTAAHAGFWVDDAFLLVYRAGVLGFSRIVGWTDRYLVDGVVNVVSAWTVMGGAQLRRMQTGKVQDYVFGVAVGVLGAAVVAGSAAVTRLPILSIITWAPFVAALVIMAFGRTRPLLVRYSAALAAGVSSVGALWILWAYDQGRAGFQFGERLALVPSLGIAYELGVDGMSVVLVLLTAIIILAGVFASWTVKTRDQEFYALLLLLVTGVFGVFVSLDLFLFFLFYEIAVLPMYLLIGIWGSSGEVPPRGVFGWAYRRTGVGTKEYAAMKLTLYLLLGSAFILVGILALYVAAGSTSFSLLALEKMRFDPTLQSWVFLAFYVGFGILAAIFPFHTWSPDGHASAPTAVSMLHAGVLMKLGAYGVIRLGMDLLPEATHEWAWLVGLIACINIVWGAFSAMSQTDLKYVVAYSSVSHMGIVMLGAATLTESGMNGAVFQMFAHGIMTGLFFALVGLVYEKAHSRDIFRMGGFATMMPGIAAAFTIGGLSSLGLPATAGFVAEFLTFLGSWKSAYSWWLFPAVIGAFLTSLYVLRVVRAIFWGPKSEDPHFQNLPDAQGTEWVALVLLVFVLVFFGVVPALIVSPIDVSTVPILVRLGVL